MTLSLELARALATERERSLLEKAQRASLLRDPSGPTPPSSAHRRPFMLSPHHRPPPAGSVAIHVRRSAIEHARQEPKDEPRTRGRPALQSEVQDWAIRKTPSATIKATPPTSTDSTRSREPVATA